MRCIGQTNWSGPATKLSAVMIALSCLLVGLAVPRAARGETQPDSFDEVLASVVEEDGKGGGSTAALLEKLDVKYVRSLVAERLPRTGSYLADVHLRWRERNLRLPVKAKRREGGGWRLEWLPSRTYVEALVDLLSGGRLLTLSSPSSARWTNDPRMPALPIVVMEGRATTPFGTVPLDGDEVQPPAALGKQISRWTEKVLEGDSAPAAVEIIASGETSWRRLTRVLFGAASAGLFRVHLVHGEADSRRLHQTSLLAPVFESGARPRRSESFVVGMYGASPVEFRLVVGGRQLRSERQECPETMSLCPEGPAAFEEAVPKLVREAFSEERPSVAQVMFAATGDISISEALPYALRLPPALGIPGPKLYLGHIGENAEGRSR